MKNLTPDKILLYLAIGLMIPTFIIALFLRNKYPVLGPALAITGLVLLTIITFFSKKQ